jgi:hypothetical protein
MYALLLTLAPRAALPSPPGPAATAVIAASPESEMNSSKDRNRAIRMNSSPSVDSSFRPAVRGVEREGTRSSPAQEGR